MKTAMLSMMLAFVVAVSALAQSKPSGMKVPDAPTAVAIAEKVLTDIYGKKIIESERPFGATLSNGVWHVAGTLRCKDENGNLVIGACVGGVAMADIRQRDGRVLRTGHTK